MFLNNDFLHLCRYGVLVAEMRTQALEGVAVLLADKHLVISFIV